MLKFSGSFVYASERVNNHKERGNPDAENNVFRIMYAKMSGKNILQKTNKSENTFKFQNALTFRNTLSFRNIYKLIFFIFIVFVSGCEIPNWGVSPTPTPTSTPTPTPIIKTTPVSDAVTHESFTSNLPVISITTKNSVSDDYRSAQMTIYTNGFAKKISEINADITENQVSETGTITITPVSENDTSKKTVSDSAETGESEPEENIPYTPETITESEEILREFLDTAEKSYNSGIQIKLRGNSTRYRDKRPYTIKLDTKTNLFGMGANKHYVLLANDIDHTQIRNQITLDFARNIGMEYTPESILVSLEIDGDYVGVYELCEQIRVGKARIDIYDWEDLYGEDYPLSADKIGTLPAPETGGFILEADFYAFNNSSVSALITSFQQPFYFNTPKYVSKTTGLYEYAYNYIQSFEYALHSPDFIYHADGTHYAGSGKYFSWDSDFKWHSALKEVSYTCETYDNMHYSELFDMDSLINNFLVCEITDNWDSMKNSTFLYKDLDGLAFMGPPWDYDWAYGNINMYGVDTDGKYEWQTTNEYFTNENYYQSVQWNRYLIRDPYFVMLLYEKWHDIRDTAVSGMIDEIDYYTEALATDGKLNDMRWSYTYNRHYYGGRMPEVFAKACKSLKSFVTKRINWLDTQFSTLDTLISSLGAYTADTSFEITYDEESKKLYMTAIRQDFDSCRLQINGTTLVTVSADSLIRGYDISKYVTGTESVMILVYPLKDGEYMYSSGEADILPRSNYVYIAKK